MKLRFPILLSLLLAASVHAGETRHVYFIGNSLTMSSTLDRVHGLFAQRRIDLQFGSQLSGGKSLIRHLRYQEEPEQKWNCWETRVPAGDTFTPDANFYQTAPAQWRFGRYDQALPGHPWDGLVLQPYQSPLPHDLEAIPALIREAMTDRPPKAVYLYQTWPSRPRVKDADDSNPAAPLAENIDYPALWTQPYAAASDDSGWQAAKASASRAYFDRLWKELPPRLPANAPRLRLIPAGEVLFALDAKIKAGELPGLAALAARAPAMLPGMRRGSTPADGVNILYADPIHLNPIPHQESTLGIFVVGTTLFSVISGQSPVGLSATAYGLDDQADAELIRFIQELVWKVVTADPRCGITLPSSPP